MTIRQGRHTSLRGHAFSLANKLLGVADDWIVLEGPRSGCTRPTVRPDGDSLPVVSRCACWFIPSRTGVNQNVQANSHKSFRMSQD